MLNVIIKHHYTCRLGILRVTFKWGLEVKKFLRKWNKELIALQRFTVLVVLQTLKSNEKQ